MKLVISSKTNKILGALGLLGFFCAGPGSFLRLKILVGLQRRQRAVLLA